LIYLFTGTIPEDWVEGSGSMISLRSLYLDGNRLSGSLPEKFGSIGRGRLNQMILRDNQFTGEVPGGQTGNFLLAVEFQNNNFTGIDDSICRQAVWNGGELVTLRSDCEACTCQYFCGESECY